MKKFIFSLLMAFVAVIGTSAQTAVQTSKVFDNTYVGLTGGVTTPLDFNSVFPLNTAVGLKLGKEVTPVLGFEVEGLAAFNDNHFGDFKTGIKATNVDFAGVVNLSNLFGGYPGKPRAVEFKTNTGLGWLHTYSDISNALTAKTSLDAALNLGSKRAVSVVVSPGVYWNLSGFNNTINSIKFNKNRAQFAVMASLIWHFQTSNGTRYFKTYDVGAMLDEIGRLNEELAKKPQTVIQEKIVEKVIIKENTGSAASNENEWIVGFDNNSYFLTPEAKFILNQVGNDAIVDVTATATPVGTKEYNQRLSERRAAAVADYLTKRGVNVTSYAGEGINAERGKTAIVKPAK